MADYRGVLYDGVPLLNDDGTPVVYDADTYPDGPPPDCCCGCPCCDCQTYVATVGNLTGGAGCDAVEGPYPMNTTDECGPWAGHLNGNAPFGTAGTLTQMVAGEECFFRLRIGPAIAPAQADYILDGHLWSCSGCNTMVLDPFSIIGSCVWPPTVEVCCADEPMMMMAGAQAESRQPITDAEAKQLFGDDADDPTLLGNRIAALTEAIGIPPCGGCGKRKKWLNKAHAWLRGMLASRQ